MSALALAVYSLAGFASVVKLSSAADFVSSTAAVSLFEFEVQAVHRRIAARIKEKVFFIM